VALGVSPASAATAGTAWRCGGNAGIKANGANFLGPTNKAPLIFKTSSGGSPSERMRIAPSGRIGIGTKQPKMPLDVSGDAASVIRGTNVGTSAGAAGVSGVSGAGFGVTGESTSGAGLAGKSVTGNGVAGTSTGGAGVVGDSADSIGVTGTGGYAGASGSGGSFGGIFTGGGYGMYGSGPTGVYASGSNFGVYGATSNPNSAAIQGDGGQYAVRGVSARTAGVRGDSGYVGVWGEGPAYGVYGLASGSGGYAVMGQASGAATWGLYSIGNCGVQGTLTKLAGSFRIDHPLDPERKYLSHSFVESPDMMNVYNGTVVVDGRGEAEVTLPDYFEVLNRDFRYQLTAIGGPSPDLHVKTEVEGNRFTIGGAAPGSRVSWQVTGIRHDDYARAHPIIVEESKPAEQQGTRMFVPKGSASRQFVPRAAAAAAPAGAPLAAPEDPRPRLR
jgi:hypothetical protein